MVGVGGVGWLCDNTSDWGSVMGMLSKTATEGGGGRW